MVYQLTAWLKLKFLAIVFFLIMPRILEAIVSNRTSCYIMLILTLIKEDLFSNTN